MPALVWIPAQQLLQTTADYEKDIDAGIPVNFRVRPVVDAATPTAITRGFAALGGREVIFSDPDLPFDRLERRLQTVISDLRTERLSDVPQVGAEAKYGFTRYTLQVSTQQIDGVEVLEMVEKKREKRRLFGRRKKN